MRIAKDERLNDLCNGLANIEFIPDPNIEALVSHGESTRRVWQRAYYSAMMQQFHVKMSIGRSGQVTVGKTKLVNKAVRFADCATIFFWKYRKRKRETVITDSDLNLGVRNAQHELANNAPLIAHLKAVEAHLLRSGQLDPTGDVVLAYSTMDIATEATRVRKALELFFTGALPALKEIMKDKGNYIAIVEEKLEEATRILMDIESKTRNAERRTITLEPRNLNPETFSSQPVHLTPAETIEQQREAARNSPGYYDPKELGELPATVNLDEVAAAYAKWNALNQQ
jgi:hypothetical protein